MGKVYRGHGRRDRNHNEITALFIAMGCTVLDLGDVGGGCPDLMIGIVGFNVLVEVKAGEKSTYTPAQHRFNAEWRGQRVTVRSSADAVNLVASVRKAARGGTPAS